MILLSERQTGQEAKCLLKKCHQLETDRGGHTVRPDVNAQLTASRNVIGRETLQIESGDTAGGRAAGQADRQRKTTALGTDTDSPDRSHRSCAVMGSTRSAS